MTNRLILLLSLLGVVLTVHLRIQEEHNFDHGCWGLEMVAEAGAANACQHQALDRTSPILGISNTALGYLFYIATSVLVLSQSVLQIGAAKACRTAAEVLVGLAFPYSLYLMIAQFRAGAICPLCLVSALLVGAIFILSAGQYFKKSPVLLSPADRAAETGLAYLMSFMAIGACFALLLFSGGLSIADSKGTLAKKPAQPPLKIQEWLTDQTPYLGNAQGVSVVGFFDPNCPHCSGVFSTLTKLAEEYKDRAAIYVFPRMLWDISLVEVEALELAKPSGKYFDLWQLEFEHRRKGGLGVPDIKELFDRLGLDARDLETRLASVRSSVLTQRDKAKAAGVNSTPVLFVGGTNVMNSSRLEKDLMTLIDATAQARRAKGASANAPDMVSAR
jgi:protein-disulfide isomerase